MRQIVFAVFFLFVLLTGVSSFGQGVRVGPDGEASKQTLSLPYAFYNENFGFAEFYTALSRLFINMIAYFRYKVNRDQGEHGNADN